MGVWIETSEHGKSRQSYQVTPCMGVWIETLSGLEESVKETCHTLYGCVD